jgi:hypothetical protein
MGEVDAAAARVRTAMRALEAYRHDGAPTLEVEYRRALEAYFLASERAAGHDTLDDAEDAEIAESEGALDRDRLDDVERDRTAISGHYAAAKRALRLARAYHAEPQSTGRRERECVAVAQRHREEIRALRLRIRPEAEQLALPGLAKTRPAEAAPARISRTG